MAKRRRTTQKAKRRRTTQKVAPKKPTKKKRKSPSTSGGAKCGSLLANLMVPHPEVTSIRFPDQHYGDSISHTVETIGIFKTITANERFANGGDTVPENKGWEIGSYVHTFIPGRLENSHYQMRVRGDDSKIGTFGFTQNNSDDLALIDGSVDSFRCTGATVEIEYIGDSNNNGGEMIIMKYDLPNGYNTFNINDFPLEMDSDVKSRKFSQARHGCFVTSFKSDFEQYGDLVPPTSDDASASLEAITVRISGAHNEGATFRYKFRQNIEIRPSKGDFLHKLAKLPPPHLPVVHTAYDMAARTLHSAGLDIAPAGAEHAVRSHVASVCHKSMTAASAALNGGTTTAAAMNASMFVGPALRLRKGSSPAKADIDMQSRGPHPIPEPVKIPDVEMDPTPNIVEIGSSANIVEMEPPPKLPEKHLKEWEIQVINRGMSVIRKHDGDDSIFRKEEKLLIKQGLKILKNNDIDSSSFFQGREKKQKIFENDESHLLHQDKKPKTGYALDGELASIERPTWEFLYNLNPKPGGSGSSDGHSNKITKEQVLTGVHEMLPSTNYCGADSPFVGSVPMHDLDRACLRHDALWQYAKTQEQLELSDKLFVAETLAIGTPESIAAGTIVGSKRYAEGYLGNIYPKRAGEFWEGKTQAEIQGILDSVYHLSVSQDVYQPQIEAIIREANKKTRLGGL